MEWIVNIEGKEKQQRISVVYDIINNVLYFYGEYRKKGNNFWHRTSDRTNATKININNGSVNIEGLEKQELTTEIMTELIFKEYENMCYKLEKKEEIEKILEKLKLVEINDGRFSTTEDWNSDSDELPF